jgi:hypothetical protein
MRSYLLFALVLPTLAVQTSAVSAQITLLPQNPSVKLRLEIELRGVLKVTEKAVTLTNQETVSGWAKNPNPQPGAPDLTLQSKQVDKVWVLELDAEQRKIAKTLDGKEVTAIGKCQVLGVTTRAETRKTAPKLGTTTIVLPRGGGSVETLKILPEGLATEVQAELLLDDSVIVISLKAAK